MPIRLHPHPAHGWSVLVYADPYSFVEWQAAMQQVFANAQGRPLRLLVDRRRSSTPTTAFVRSATSFLQERAPVVPGGRVAVVATSKAGYSMARMTEILTLAGGVSCNVVAFRSIRRATTWLRTGVPVEDEWA